eukprot:scaffold1528_cov198-Pinguiococcus_pyrenoidosus.AAC.18
MSETRRCSPVPLRSRHLPPDSSGRGSPQRIDSVGDGHAVHVCKVEPGERQRVVLLGLRPVVDHNQEVSGLKVPAWGGARRDLHAEGLVPHRRVAVVVDRGGVLWSLAGHGACDTYERELRSQRVFPAWLGMTNCVPLTCATHDPRQGATFFGDAEAAHQQVVRLGLHALRHAGVEQRDVQIAAMRRRVQHFVQRQSLGLRNVSASPTAPEVLRDGAFDELELYADEIVHLQSAENDLSEFAHVAVDDVVVELRKVLVALRLEQRRLHRQPFLVGGGGSGHVVLGQRHNSHGERAAVAILAAVRIHTLLGEQRPKSAA